VGDELVDLEPALEVVADETGELRTALDTAKGAPLPNAAGNKLECCPLLASTPHPERGKHTPSGNFLPSSGNSNDDALAPALVAGLESRTHDLDVAGAVKGVVASAIRHLGELVDNRLALGELGRVDKVRRAKLARPLLLGRVHIHHDDLARLLRHRALDNAQPDTPRAKHGNVAALLHIGRDPRRAISRRDAASQQASAVHRRLGLHRHHADVAHDRVLAEGARAHEVQDVLAAGAEARRPVGHHALALGRADLAAQVRLARPAELALLALGRVQRHHVVAGLDRRDALADGFDDARALVSEDDGEGALRVLAGERVGVRVAHARVVDLDADFAGARREDLDVFVAELLAGAPGDGGLAGDGLAGGERVSESMT